MLIKRKAIKKRVLNTTKLLIVVSALSIGSCSLAPALKMPEVHVAQNYKETAPWMPARPADELSRGPWWELFGDSQLNGLEQRLTTNNPDLAAAIARNRQAQA